MCGTGADKLLLGEEGGFRDEQVGLLIGRKIGLDKGKAAVWGTAEDEVLPGEEGGRRDEQVGS